jgi:hypothetical protein
MRARTLLICGGTIIVSFGVGALVRALTFANAGLVGASAKVTTCGMDFEDDIRDQAFGERGAFVRNHREQFASVSQALAPGLNVRFQNLKKCLRYDREPHPLTRIVVEWNLFASKSELRASRFVLKEVAGQDRGPIERCFGSAFSEPVILRGVPEPGASLSYNGVAPSLLTYRF